MGDMGDIFNAWREERRAKRIQYGVRCPACIAREPKRNATILLPGQKCFCGYKDTRKITDEGKGKEKAVKKLDPILYQPRGRAAEYVDNGLAANLFLGCNHGCKYCYVPGQKRMSAETFHKQEVGVKQHCMERLERDLKRLGKQQKPIFMSFMCDPYPADPDLWHVTREAIRAITGAGNAVNILTKGGMRAARDFMMLLADPRNKVGATLTFLDADISKQWEPHAATPDSRLEMLSTAKDLGIATWASIDPVIIPAESIKVILAAMPYVDEFKIGKWNHNDQANDIDWPGFLKHVEKILTFGKKKFTIKEDLLEAAGRKPKTTRKE